jgi:CDP-diacylglycerol--serine O-phosphatidyltransferase
MFVLPNLFTVSSIFCGFYAIVLASGDPGPQQFYQASLAVFFGIFFDMADGRVARLTRTQSDFGIQLDSLADVITFGVAPSIIVFKWGLVRLGFVGAVAAFVYMACGALRLARFNVLAQRGVGSKSFFTGLPIPLAAGVLVSLVMFHQVTFAAAVVREVNILVLILVLSYLMISNVRYRSFKDVHLSTLSVAGGFTIAAIFAALAALMQPTFALLAFFSVYVLLGLIEEVVRFARRQPDVHATAGVPPGGKPGEDVPPSTEPGMRR